MATATFIRHAESEFNVALGGDESIRFEESMKRYVDCGITEAGVSRCMELRGEIEADFIVVSPLTRALQTAALLYPGIVDGTLAHIVQPLATEHLLDACDFGTTKEALNSRFPWANTALLPATPWWYSGKALDEVWSSLNTETPFEPEDVFDERVARLKDYLAKLPYKRVVVVTHSNLIFNMTKYEKDGDVFGQWVDNNAAVELPLGTGENV